MLAYGGDTVKYKARDLFEKTYGYIAESRLFFSPGRVNLIGEHIDYNGGMVFPCALSLGTTGLIALRNDRQIRLISGNFPEMGVIDVDLDHLEYHNHHGWANYLKGIIKAMRENGYPIPQGFDVALIGDLPSGAGLSSSASVELLMAFMLNETFRLAITRKDLAILAQEVENHYIKVNCGIMDQFVVSCGVEGHALLLDTRTLDYETIPLHLGDYAIVICNSKVSRGLADSKYNERRQECEAALHALEPRFHVPFLCMISYPDFIQNQDLITDPVLRKRAKHVISEHYRTLRSYHLLKNQDLLGFGEMLLESHYSLKTDYEVSCKELDVLVELAMAHGSIGSRMTGAGFGGSTVNIVKKSDINHFREAVAKAYFRATHFVPDILIAEPSDGVKELENS